MVGAESNAVAVGESADERRVSAAANSHTEAEESDPLGAALAAGDPRALTDAYRRWAPAIRAEARRSLGEEPADDVAQEVFLRLWRIREQFAPSRGSLRAFVETIARSTIANERRRRARHPGELQGDEPQLDLLDAGAEPADELSFRAHRAAVLARALSALPANERDALRMAFFDELTHEEIARQLRIPLGTAKSRVRAGVRRLAWVLGTSLVLAAALLLVRHALDDRAHLRQEALADRALAMLTASDMIDRRLAPTRAGDLHAHLRTRPGDTLAVVTLSNAPPLAGASANQYALYVRSAARWTRLGTLAPTADGRARAIFDSAVLAAPLDEAIISLERRPADGEAASALPSGDIVARWSAP